MRNTHDNDMMLMMIVSYDNDKNNDNNRYMMVMMINRSSSSSCLSTSSLSYVSYQQSHSINTSTLNSAITLVGQWGDEG